MVRTFLPKVSLIFFTAILAASFVAAAVVFTASSGSSEQIPDAIYGVGDDVVLPSSSLTHWVSYASQVSVVTVVNEVELPVPSEISGERGGGYVGRSVDLRIDENLWTYPGTDPETGTISLVANGWIQKGDVKIPFGTHGAERLELGNTYVIPLVQYEGGWGWLGAATMLPVDSAQRIVVDPLRISNLTSQQLHGMSFGELAERLDGEIPDPVAALYAHLPSVERFHARNREVIPNYVE